MDGSHSTQMKVRGQLCGSFLSLHLHMAGRGQCLCLLVHLWPLYPLFWEGVFHEPGACLSATGWPANPRDHPWDLNRALAVWAQHWWPQYSTGGLSTALGGSAQPWGSHIALGGSAQHWGVQHSTGVWAQVPASGSLRECRGWNPCLMLVDQAPHPLSYLPRILNCQSFDSRH